MNWNWFKKSNKEEEHDHEVEYLAIPLTTLIRNIVYDSLLSDPQQISHKLGLPPISEEVSEKEAEESQLRLENIAALIPIIEAHAQISAEISLAGYSSIVSVEEGDSENKELLISFFKAISLSSSMSCLSTLFDLGLLETPVMELDVYGK